MLSLHGFYSTPPNFPSYPSPLNKLHQIANALSQLKPPCLRVTTPRRHSYFYPALKLEASATLGKKASRGRLPALGKTGCFTLFSCLCVLFIFMCLHIGDGIAVFVRKIEIFRGVICCKSRPGMEKKIFIFLQNSKIVLA